MTEDELCINLKDCWQPIGRYNDSEWNDNKYSTHIVFWNNILYVFDTKQIHKTKFNLFDYIDNNDINLQSTLNWSHIPYSNNYTINITFSTDACLLFFLFYFNLFKNKTIEKNYKIYSF